MNVDKYNYTFYQGIYILIFLIIISFLTYLFKYDNVKYAINFFILFVILLLAILCSSTFKNNIIENYADENTASQQRNYNDISNTDITSLTIAIADEPFGRLSNSYGGFFTSTYDADYCADSFKKLYKHGYRGFHIYVEYPLNDPNVPYCVLPYKDNNGMNSISTRGNKIKLTTVLDGLYTAYYNTFFTTYYEPVFLCITCLSTEKENLLQGIHNLLTNNEYSGIVSTNYSATNKLSTIIDRIFVTLSTYDGMPLSKNDFATHYFIKETELKYAAFNVVSSLGLYSPLIKYTRHEQDTFSTRGFDQEIQQNMNIAFANGVQFVCAPPTQYGITRDLSDNVSYDYPNTIANYKIKFTVPGSNDISPYQVRNTTFISALGGAIASQRIDDLELKLESDISDNSGNIAANTRDISDNIDNIAANTRAIDVNVGDISYNTRDISGNFGDIQDLLDTISGSTRFRYLRSDVQALDE